MLRRHDGNAQHAADVRGDHAVGVDEVRVDDVKGRGLVKPPREGQYARQGQPRIAIVRQVLDRASYAGKVHVDRTAPDPGGNAPESRQRRHRHERGNPGRRHDDRDVGLFRRGIAHPLGPQAALGSGGSGIVPG